MDPIPISDQQTEAVRFLARDFQECFKQMRYYDGQIIGICKFACILFTAVIGGALVLQAHGLAANADYSWASVAILFPALLFGILFLALVVRDRIYFVLLSRYINHHRRFFLEEKPLGFSNETRMYYLEMDQPPYFSWASSQALLLYVLAVVNAGVLTLALFQILVPAGYYGGYILGVSVCFLAGELVWSVGYLLARQRKTRGA